MCVVLSVCICMCLCVLRVRACVRACVCSEVSSGRVPQIIVGQLCAKCKIRTKKQRKTIQVCVCLPAVMRRRQTLATVHITGSE